MKKENFETRKMKKIEAISNLGIAHKPGTLLVRSRRFSAVFVSDRWLQGDPACNLAIA
jgi:hypothetical protein